VRPGVANLECFQSLSQLAQSARGPQPDSWVLPARRLCQRYLVSHGVN